MYSAPTKSYGAEAGSRRDLGELSSDIYAVAYRDTRGTTCPPSEKTQNGHKEALVNPGWSVVLPAKEASQNTRRTPPMEITLREFPPMEITPKSPDYSCPAW